MEDMSKLIILILCILCGVLFFIFNPRKRIGKQLPGPKGHVLIGNLLDVKLETLHLSLFEWSKEFGDIFQIKVGLTRLISLNTSDIIRELLLKEPNATILAARPPSFVGKYFGNYSDVFFASLDKRIIRRRKFLHKQLHSYGDGLKCIVNQIQLSLVNLTQEIHELDERTCDPTDLIDDFVLGTLQMLLIGKISEKPERRKEFQMYIKDLNHGLNGILIPRVSYIFRLLPFLRFTPLPAAKTFRKCIEKRDGLLKFLTSFTENDEVHEGVFQHMLKALKEEPANDWLNEDSMVAMLSLNIVFGGYITTRNMLISIIRILLSSPDVQKKLQDEVDTKVGKDRKPTLSDRHKMPYTEAVILECLRYISHLPLSGPHWAAEDIIFRGYHIPKGSILLPNQWAAHHSETEWTNPFHFDPNRFLNKDGNIVPADHPMRKQVINFGVGKRSCIGEVFAKTRIFLLLSTLMQICTVVPEDGNVPPMLNLYEMLPLGIQRPPDFRCKFVKRYK